MRPASYILYFARTVMTLFIVVGFTVSIAALAVGHKSVPAAETNAIVDVAVGAGSFSTLVTALQAADLVDA